MASRINRGRLLGRLETFSRIGALPGGGNCRLALSDEDRAGRDLLAPWMRGLGSRSPSTRSATSSACAADARTLAPVMLGSHVDTVGTGGANLD
jgi:N-carbamoyl-L-amino-acid hydrolase